MRLKRILLFGGVCLFVLSIQAQSLSSSLHPKREFRAAWIQTVHGHFRDMPTRQLQDTLLVMLDSLRQVGMNAVIFQVRPEADTFYSSELEPWSRFLTGEQGKKPEPEWDPMRFMIEECHRRAMEFHAWINPYRVKNKLDDELASTHIYNRHPEWFVVYGDQLFFDPALPESREHICRVVGDIVRRYDIDAIHMDDYFYPYPIKGQDFPDNESFIRYGENFTDKGDWRRNNVNLLIEKVHKTIREIKPWVKFGISPFAIYRNATTDPLGSRTGSLQNYNDLYADVLLWLREGWVDYNIPQLYWEIGHPRADYKELVEWWARHAEERPLFIGQSVENSVRNVAPNNPAFSQLGCKMMLQRSFPEIGGSCQWSAFTLLADTAGYRERLKREYHKYPALPPVFTFIDNQAPGKVRKLTALWVNGEYMLQWHEPKYKSEMDRAVQYVVYRFTSNEKIDLDDPLNIVSIVCDNFYRLPYKDGETEYRYVVTALDRLHNESAPMMSLVKL